MQRKANYTHVYNSPPFYTTDWVLKRNGRVVGVAEFKGRAIDRKHRTIFLSLRKYEALRKGSKQFRVPGYFVSENHLQAGSRERTPLYRHRPRRPHEADLCWKTRPARRGERLRVDAHAFDRRDGIDRRSVSRRGSRFTVSSAVRRLRRSSSSRSTVSIRSAFIPSLSARKTASRI